MNAEQPRWKKKTIRNYHLESDIFHMKEEINNNQKKTVRSGRCFIESNKEPQKESRPHKVFIGEQLKQTIQKDWNTNRMRPDIRKEDSDNTLAYDLTKQPPKVEKTQKRMIKDPYPKQSVKQGINCRYGRRKGRSGDCKEYAGRCV